MDNNVLQKGQGIALKIVFVVISFAIAKGIVGFISGSVVLLADAVHSLADAFSTILVWLGLKISRRKPNQKFPYGYYKAENLSTLLVSLLIFYAGFEIIRVSIAKLTVSTDLHIPLVAISVALLDAIVMFLVGSYEVKIGKKIHAQSLIADGSESKMHVLSSSVVLVGLLASWLHVPYVEGIAGIIISLFIFSVGIVSAKNSILSLMDVSPNPSIEKKIRKIIKQTSSIQSLDILKLRESGPFIFGEAKVQIHSEVNVTRAHRITEEIEGEIKKQIPEIDSFLIYVEPPKKKKFRLAIPVRENQLLKSRISQSFSHSPFFAFVTLEKEKITSLVIKENPYQKKTLRAGLSVGHYLIKHKVNVVLTPEIGAITFHILGDDLVQIYQVQEQSLAQVIQDFLEGKLSLLSKPTTKKK